MTYQQLKHDYMQNEITRLSDKYCLFFAFNDKQLAEGKAKHNISDDEPLVTVLGGGIIPKKNKSAFYDEFNSIHDKMIEEIKKLDPEPIINYELANYESWYTGDITDAYEVLKDYGYTRDQVIAVYRKYAKDHEND